MEYIEKIFGQKIQFPPLDEVHQRAFDPVKATIARDVVLAYPGYLRIFEIYTDASSK